MSTPVAAGGDREGALRLSAIVCTRNRAAWSRRAVASLLAQDVHPELLEIVVVDNASSDDTAGVLTALVEGHDNARYVYEPELGLSNARNRGILESSGAVIAFVDDDAEAGPGWARHYLDRFGADHDVVGAAGRIELGWPAARPRWLHRGWDGMYAGLDLGDLAHDLAAPQIPYGANMAFRRSAVGGDVRFAVNLGRRGEDLTSGEERELFERLRAAGGRIVYVPEARVTHHVLPDRVGRRWFLRRVAAQGRTNVLLATVLRPRRSRAGWLARAGLATARATRELLRAAWCWITWRSAADRMDGLARAVQNAATASAALRLAFARGAR